MNSIMNTLVNVKNLYGYYIIYYGYLEFLQINNFKGKVRKGIQKEFIFVRNKFELIYNQITDDEKYKEIIFNNILEIIKDKKEIK